MKNFFSSKIFGDNELEHLSSRIINTVINAALTVGLITVFLLISGNVHLQAFTFVMIFSIIALFARIAYNQGHFKTSTRIMLFDGFLVTVGMVYTHDTVYLPTTSILFLVIALSGTIFGLRSALLTAITSSIMAGALLYLQANNIIGVSADPPSRLTGFITYSILFITAGLMIGLTHKAVKDSIAKFRAEYEANLQLIREEKKLNTAIDQTPLAICLMNKEGFITFANVSYVKLMGLTADELLGSRRTSHLKQTTTDEQANNLLTSLQEHKTLKQELVTLMDGEKVYLQQTFSPIIDASGEIEGFLEALENVTQKRRLELAQISVLNVFQKVSQATELIDIYTMLHGALNEIMDAKNFTVAIYDEPSQMINFPYSYDELDDEDIHAIPFGGGMTSKVIQENKVINLTTKEIVTDQAIKFIGDVPICWMGAPLTYDGVTFGAILIQRYTGRDHYTVEEESILQMFSSHLSAAIHNAAVTLELNRSTKRYKEIAENIPEAFWVSFGEFITTIYVNSPIEDLTGFTAEELNQSQMTFYDHVLPQFQPELQAVIDRQQKGEHTSVEFLFRRADGMYRWFREEAYPVEKMADGRYRVVGYTQDITPIKEAENRLRTLNEDLEKRVEHRTMELRENRDKLANTNKELESALKSKDEFFASMSHELRTPLTGILGLSEALQYQIYGEMNDQQLGMIKNIEQSGKHLLDLINDILDVAKMEAGHLALDIQLAGAVDICNASLQLTKGMAKQKNLNVTFVNHTEDLVIAADAKRVKQVLVNLLSNAIKFTPDEGNIGLELKENKENKEVIFTVWDQGIGIREDEREKLFQPFVQLESGLSKRFKGTGLGLSLVMNLVGLHNGRVSLDSNYGEGSRFTVTLPIDQEDKTVSEMLSHQVQDGGEIKRAKNIGHGHKVMVIDDNELITETLRDFLVANGFEPVIYLSGVNALKNILNDSPDIVLCDIQMPVMDGFEVIRRIREMGDRYTMIPIVAVTALAMEFDEQKCLDAGADHYLAKPLSLTELAELLGTDEFRHGT